MTDAEISRRLALAIGRPFAERSIVRPLALVFCDGMTGGREFDYRDPAVIWPIAEQFDAFPTMRHGRGWLSQIAPLCPHPTFYTDTAAKAVALAVINAKEQT